MYLCVCVPVCVPVCAPVCATGSLKEIILVFKVIYEKLSMKAAISHPQLTHEYAQEEAKRKLKEAGNQL